MTAYCSAQDVRNALTSGGDKTDKETAAGLPDWQIADAIEEASAIVETHISTRYKIEVKDGEQTVGTQTVDIEVADAPVRWWTRDIAAFLATLTFRKGKDLAEDDPIRLRFNMAMGFLTAVRDGSMNLPNFPGADTSGDAQGVEVFNKYEGTLFEPEDLGLSAASDSTRRVMFARRWW